MFFSVQHMSHELMQVQGFRPFAESNERRHRFCAYNFRRDAYYVSKTVQTWKNQGLTHDWNFILILSANLLDWINSIIFANFYLPIFENRKVMIGGTGRKCKIKSFSVSNVDLEEEKEWWYIIILFFKKKYKSFFCFILHV